MKREGIGKNGGQPALWTGHTKRELQIQQVTILTVLTLCFATLLLDSS